MGRFISNGRVIDTDVGARFRQWRDTKKIPQKEAAHMLGCSNSFLSLLENGERTMTVEMTAHIAKTFEIDYIWLLTGLNL